jgi:hypothetical protein
MLTMLLNLWVVRYVPLLEKSVQWNTPKTCYAIN